MFFSIIIPSYNRKYLLKIAIESVLEQTFKDFELIIVDDGSTDKTKELVETYKDKRIKYFYQENKGPASARNLGIKNSSGEYICFLDSDDRFRRQKLELTKDYIEKYPLYKIFHTEELWYRNFQYLEQKKIHKKPEGSVFCSALKVCCISLSCACINREVFNKVGLFDEDFPVCEDYEFWLRATLFFPVKLIPFYLTIKEAGPHQQSQKKGLDKYRLLALYKLIKNYQLPGGYLEPALKNLEEKAKIYIKGAEKRGKTSEVRFIREKIEEINKIYGTRVLF
ncbi:MAG: glycosyltransferase family 2 protein [Candidatus Omnitrophota bacterium]|nr:MAG: glycosyltransferase family 2 protein [Candidatus Omnitrophota bacterium]RKY35020.1 MAG: glycosyltransferase family 2 protein [Candidatus Omnitrophota bacterium]RKY44185.1 MAG: glycosyltransferase family 2 protein [Candidatus Omnitrophota bacterium]